jgi:hypothetical protein
MATLSSHSFVIFLFAKALVTTISLMPPMA